MPFVKKTSLGTSGSATPVPPKKDKIFPVKLQHSIIVLMPSFRIANQAGIGTHKSLLRIHPLTLPGFYLSDKHKTCLSDIKKILIRTIWARAKDMGWEILN
jgi:hypothetical protein